MTKRFNQGFTLIELIVVIAVLGILAAILAPVVGSHIERANNQADIANARLLLSATTIAFVADNLKGDVYTTEDDGSSPLPFREMVGQTWPIARIGDQPFLVDVDLSRDDRDVIQVIRMVDEIPQVYQIDKAIFD